MRTLAMTFRNGVASLDTKATVTGIRLLTQKITLNLLTWNGSDKVVPSRGTALDKTLSAGVNDVPAIQHALNFAAVKTAVDVRAFESPTQDAASALGSCQLQFAGFAGGRVSAIIRATNKAGEQTAPPISI